MESNEELINDKNVATNADSLSESTTNNNTPPAIADEDSTTPVNEDDELAKQADEDANEDKDDKGENSISSDLIRGHINTIILRALYERDKYGYEIIDDIEEKSHNQYTLKQPTLYSALKRLERQGYIKAYWKTDQVTLGGRRKYFTLTDSGRLITEKNLAEWEYSRTIIDSLISDKSFDFANPAPKPVDFAILRDSVSRVPVVKTSDGETDNHTQSDKDSKVYSEEQLEEIKRRVVEEERAKYEEELKQKDEERARIEEQLKLKDEEHAKYEEQIKIKDEEHAKYEEELKTKSEERAKFEEELRLTEEARRKSEEEILRLEQERRRLEEEKSAFKAEEEKRLQEERIRLKEEQEKRLEEERQRLKEEEERRIEEEKRRITHENYLRLVSEPADRRMKNEQAAAYDCIDGTEKLLYNNKPETERDYKNLVDAIYDKTLINGSTTYYQSSPSAQSYQRQSVRCETEQGNVKKQSSHNKNIISKGKEDGVTIRPSDDGASAYATRTTYNKGLTLLKSSVVVLAITMIEWLFCLIFKDNLNTGVMYSITILLIGLVQFAICLSLSLVGYGKVSVRPANNWYISMCAILCVICILIISLLAVLLNINTSMASDIMKKLVIPCITALNLPIFAVSFKYFIK